MSKFHLAGIIPVAGQPLDFKMPWPDSMMPLNEDYLAVEHSVVECAYAGCETIWIVCNDDIQPLIKSRLGDYVQDPVWSFRKYEKAISNFNKPIPIYYVPIHPNDRNKRDSLGWSVLYGAYMAWKTARSMSKWIAPDKFYVSFPLCVYTPYFLREIRKKISSPTNSIIECNGKTILDGEPLPFTFDFEMSSQLTRDLKKKAYDHSLLETRNFSLHDIFGGMDMEQAETYNIDECWKIDSWENFSRNIFEISQKIKRPSKYILKTMKFKGMGNNGNT